jgi:hypothetical protein
MFMLGQFEDLQASILMAEIPPLETIASLLSGSTLSVRRPAWNDGLFPKKPVSLSNRLLPPYGLATLSIWYELDLSPGG